MRISSIITADTTYNHISAEPDDKNTLSNKDGPDRLMLKAPNGATYTGIRAAILMLEDPD